MTAPAQTPTPVQILMHKYMHLLNEVSTLGPHGFAYVLDTANPAELAELTSAADALQRNIDRAVAAIRKPR